MTTSYLTLTSLIRFAVIRFAVIMAAVPLAGSAFANDTEVVANPTAEQEKQFSEKMSDTTLTGRFTFDDKMDQIPKPERYEIKSVTKAVGNLWTFMVRIKYGKVDATLPVTVPIVWADGTPMVSLKDAMIPGMGGGFSAHVIFEGDRYAGTWQHNSKGGHMFGSIKKTAEIEKADSPAEKSDLKKKQ